MNLQTLDLEHVYIADDPGARRIGAGAEADRLFAASVKRLGVLQSIVVRREADNRYVVRAGRRRVRAARLAGHTTIPAVVLDDNLGNDAPDLAIDAAENMARAPLAPLDQWRAVGALIDQTGCTVAQAADTLGLSELQARRMERFARLHPRLIEAMEEHGVPYERDLVVIARAPLDKQERAARARGRITKRGVEWGEIAYALNEQRIPQSRAIFDLTKSKVAFVYDPFAEPGSPGEWTTTDLKGFVREQEAALKALVGRAVENGERLFITEVDPYGRWKLPGGWQQSHEDPKRPILAHEHPHAARFVTVNTRSGPRYGEVEYTVAVDAVAMRREEQEKLRAERKRARELADAAPEEHDDEDAGGEAPTQERGPYTKKGLALIARARTEALRAKLRERELPDGNFACGWTLLALAADNVEVKGGERDELASTSTHIDDLVRQVLDGDTPPEKYPALLCEALARILSFGSPENFHGSGDAAEWIAHRLRAESALPRFDTEEFLACVSKDELTRLAEANNIKPGKTAKATRALLVGNMPQYHPASALFAGAPPPAEYVEQEIPSEWQDPGDEPEDDEAAD